MASMNCSACNEIRENAPSVVVNGMGETECNYLKNNTGLSGASDDCTDLENLNDCLIGNMEEEIEAYEICDWKTYTKMFVGNVWNVLKAIICSICGLWTRVEKLECEIGSIYSGADFQFGEEETAGGSYVVAGKGVSFMIPQGDDAHRVDANLTYIAGGLLRGAASLRFFQNNFTDEGACVNFDNGGEERTSTSRKGNSAWNSTGPIHYGELLLEYRISLTEYPQIKKMFNGFGQETAAGSYHVRAIAYEAGAEALGQSENDDKHVVPDGYIYVQLRLTSLFATIPDDHQRTPAFFMGIQMNQDEITCDDNE